ncbi:Hypothetical protein AA314_01394 [Archangium gephyra]|uniref:Uncharacterized protein n=1 Tax=Archangium gephyra TaxID=48 RepID=A0AAC8Q2E7_9BACT|nr:Hypothetical protein AA314_01394 [Archangium gephyra]
MGGGNVIGAAPCPAGRAPGGECGPHQARGEGRRCCIRR